MRCPRTSPLPLTICKGMELSGRAPALHAGGPGFNAQHLRRRGSFFLSLHPSPTKSGEGWQAGALLLSTKCRLALRHGRVSCGKWSSPCRKSPATSAESLPRAKDIMMSRLWQQADWPAVGKQAGPVMASSACEERPQPCETRRCPHEDERAGCWLGGSFSCSSSSTALAGQAGAVRASGTSGPSDHGR